MDTVTVAKRIDELTTLVKQLADSIKQLNAAYAEIVETNKELRDYVKSGQYGADFKTVLDEVKRVVAAGKKQPDVHEELYEPRYPCYGRLFEEGVLKGDIAARKVKIDRRGLIKAIIENRLSTLERVTAIKLLQKGIVYGGETP
jgi:hypothetical protein